MHLSAQRVVATAPRTRPQPTRGPGRELPRTRRWQPKRCTAGIDTGSAKLRQTLTDLLNSHVYLAGIAVEQAVLTEDPNSPQFKAAVTTLDQNSQDLAAAIESVYGPEAGNAFLKQWREHIGFFVDYTIGGLRTTSRCSSKAASGSRRIPWGLLCLPRGSDRRRAFCGGSVRRTADARQQSRDRGRLGACGDPKVFSQLYEAAHGHMPMTAAALAEAIAGQSPEDFDGDPNSAASELQAGLTDLLNSHVFLAGLRSSKRS